MIRDARRCWLLTICFLIRFFFLLSSLFLKICDQRSIIIMKTPDLAAKRGDNRCLNNMLRSGTRAFGTEEDLLRKTNIHVPTVITDIRLPQCINYTPMFKQTHSIKNIHCEWWIDGSTVRTKHSHWSTRKHQSEDGTGTGWDVTRENDSRRRCSPRDVLLREPRSDPLLCALTWSNTKPESLRTDTLTASEHKHKRAH